jgi:hypothetical protein
MANGSINLVNLDFETLKQSFKTHLSSQTAFKDYDLDGSNMSVLMDLLAYNTYINTFYMNMVSSEMFLDTAQLRDSVISHAKQLNYTPRSFRSAAAVVNFTITPTNGVTAVTIPRGTSLTSKVGSNTYTFTVDDNIVLTSASNGAYWANNITVYEGSLVTDTFIYSSVADQRFVLSNPTIDTSSLRMYVTENNASVVRSYIQANSYIGASSTSEIFFVQAAEGDLYEVVFGNGTQGRLPDHGAVISVVYRVCNGELPNGCYIFSNDDTIDGHANVRITTVSVATGGSVHETTESIRKNAPRYYQTQERAITAKDYQTILQLAYPEISSIYVFGGEEADPPRYGKVIISLDIADSAGISEGRKTEYERYLKERSPITIDPVFIEPEFLNVIVNTTVTYNINTLTVSETDLRSAIQTNIRVYNEQNLGNFNTTLRYSKLVQYVDNVNTSIISNDTEFIVYKDLNPVLYSEAPLAVDLVNPLEIINSSIANVDFYKHSVWSTYFTYRGTPNCRLEDDGVGNINVVVVPAGGIDYDHEYVATVGSVNYDTGKIDIAAGLYLNAYEGASIKIKAYTRSKDITALRNNIIQIKDSDINVVLEGETV